MTVRPESHAPAAPSTAPAAPAGRSPAGRRSWAVELVPQYLLGAAALFFAVTKGNALRSALQSPQAIAINTAIALAWLAFSLVLMPRLVRRQGPRVVITSVVAVALAWVLFANAYRDERVVETLRGLDAPAAPVTPESAPPKTDPPKTAPPDTAAATPVPDPTTPAGPVRLRSAALRGIGHRASGTASVIRRPDGSHVVGLEDIDIEPGPDYRVYVVPGNTERTAEGAVELDALRGNQGTQFYDVPRDVAVDEGEWTVLVWCKRFAVPVAAAVPV
ncbi:MAG: DM13 domain-containing protein [Acidimicrobiia bacterium]|jgi:hypothetical protein